MMYKYEVIAKGFMHGKLYEPGGKRNVLHSETKLKPVPSWLKEAQKETSAQKRKRLADDKKAAAAAAEEQKEQKEEVDFVASGETSTNVETL